MNYLLLAFAAGYLTSALVHFISTLIIYSDYRWRR